jgi:DNA topoisomerase-1
MPSYRIIVSIIPFSDDHKYYWWFSHLFIRLPTRFLIITEKPSSTRKIAYSLDDKGAPKNVKFGKVTFYVANRGEDELIIVSAVGHLYSIEQEGGGWTYPVFDIKWVPKYRQNNTDSYTRKYLNTIIKLSKNIDVYVSACDYDQEGSLIAYNIIKNGIGETALAKSKRMLYNTLTSKELSYSWENMNNALDYHVIAAGKVRHEADWLLGINLTRALTISARRYLDFKKVLSIGRVQGPTLKFIYELEQRINSFIPIPYWKISAETVIDGETYSLHYEKPRLEQEVQARVVAKNCRGMIGTVQNIKYKEMRTSAPPPFNLGDLQREAYRYFKMNPSITLKTAERLYLGAYISYPRTESNKIPPSINVKEILKSLSKNPDYELESIQLIQQKRFSPRLGKGDDPAHPAIHITGQRPGRLKQEEQRIYDLIVRRFLASLGKSLVQLKTDVDVDVNGHLFHLNGLITQRVGWTFYYGKYYSSNDHVLPKFTKGKEVSISKLTTRRQYTKHVPRFNASSLIRKMKQERVGTKSTRSNIIETLYRRGYIRSQQISITSLGENIIEVFSLYCPDIIQVKFTRDLEELLLQIETGKKDSSVVYDEVVEELKPILTQFKINEEKIGKKISDAIQGKTSDDSGNRCKVCYRNKIQGSVYCKKHNSVFEKIESNFLLWRYALGYQWLEYLEKLNKINGTGIYVKEVINNILN